MLATILLVSIHIFAGIHAQKANVIVQQIHSLRSNFDDILMEGNADLFLSSIAGNRYVRVRQMIPSVVVETTQNCQAEVSLIITEDHILSIRIGRCPDTNEPPKIFIQLTSPIRRCTMIMNENPLNGTNESTKTEGRLLIQQDGSLSTSLTLDVAMLEAFIEGVGEIQLNGQVRGQTILRVQGSRHLDASKLFCKQLLVDVQGSSTATVVATEDIQISTTGVSGVFYRLPATAQPSRIFSSGLGRAVRLS